MLSIQYDRNDEKTGSAAIILSYDAMRSAQLVEANQVSSDGGEKHT